MVKTLGSAAQAPAMRAACARCIAGLVLCLSRTLDEPGADALPAQPPLRKRSCSGAAVAQPPPPAAVSLQALCDEPDLLTNLHKCLKAGNDQAAGLQPPPAAMGPVQALAAAGSSAGVVAGDEGQGAEAAVEMAENAARCVAALIMVSRWVAVGFSRVVWVAGLLTCSCLFLARVKLPLTLTHPPSTTHPPTPRPLPPQLGVHHPFTGAAPPPPPPPTPTPANPSSTSGPTSPLSGVWSALATLRLGIAREKKWRGLLKTSIKPLMRGGSGAASRHSRVPQSAAIQRRQAYALMALHGLLGAPAAGLGSCSNAGGGDGDRGAAAPAAAAAAVAEAWRRREEVAKALMPKEGLARKMLADVLAVAHPDRSTTVRRARVCLGWCKGCGWCKACGLDAV